MMIDDCKNASQSSIDNQQSTILIEEVKFINALSSPIKQKKRNEE